MVRLADGQTKAYDEKDTEFGIVIFGGKCKISGDGFDFGEIGKRKDVFDGPCTCVYVPKRYKIQYYGRGRGINVCCQITVLECTQARSYKTRGRNMQGTSVKKAGRERRTLFSMRE